MNPPIHLTVIEGYGAFHPVIQVCMDSLQNLGYDASIDTMPRDDAVNIVLCSHKAPIDFFASLKYKPILYNFEQLSSLLWTSQRFMYNLQKNAVVWDYDQSNIKKFNSIGILDVDLVEMGYRPILTQDWGHAPQPNDNLDIDILFYGVFSPRRAKVLEAFKPLGLKIYNTMEDGVLLGPQLYETMSRSKIVLNVNYYEDASIFEIVRCSELFANCKTVVSELRPITQIYPDLRQAAVFGSADQLPQLCLELVNNESKRMAIGQQAFDLFKKRDYKNSINQALERYFSQNIHSISVASPQNLTHKPSHISSIASDVLKRVNCEPSVLPSNTPLNYQFDAINIASRPGSGADVIMALDQPIQWGTSSQSWRLGEIPWQENSIEYINARDLPGKVDDIVVLMSNILNWLTIGGVAEFTLPGLGVLQTSKGFLYKRFFNPSSLSEFCDDGWQFGWSATFQKTHESFFLNPLGLTKYQQGMTLEQILQENLYSYINVKLVKTQQTDAQKLQLAQEINFWQSFEIN